MRGPIAAVCAAAWLAGCAASGPTIAEKPEALPPLAPGKGRLYVLRDVQANGLNVDTVRPEILLNDQPMAKSVAGGVHVRDLPPGDYTVRLQPPSFGDIVMSGNYLPGATAHVTLGEGHEEFVKVRATRFQMQCTVGCAATTYFTTERMGALIGRQQAMQRVLLSVEGDKPDNK